MQKQKTCIRNGIFYLIYFIFGCAGSLLLRRPFSSCSKQGPLSSCNALLMWWLLLLWSISSPRTHGLSSCGSQALERRLNSCSTQAQLLSGMWESSQTRDWTLVSCIGRQTLYNKAPGKLLKIPTPSFQPQNSSLKVILSLVQLNQNLLRMGLRDNIFVNFSGNPRWNQG